MVEMGHVDQTPCSKVVTSRSVYTEHCEQGVHHMFKLPHILILLLILLAAYITVALQPSIWNTLPIVGNIYHEPNLIDMSAP